jgi:hypothetical protein
VNPGTRRPIHEDPNYLPNLEELLVKVARYCETNQVRFYQATLRVRLPGAARCTDALTRTPLPVRDDGVFVEIPPAGFRVLWLQSVVMPSSARRALLPAPAIASLEATLPVTPAGPSPR